MPSVLSSPVDRVVNDHDHLTEHLYYREIEGLEETSIVRHPALEFLKRILMELELESKDLKIGISAVQEASRKDFTNCIG